MGWKTCNILTYLLMCVIVGSYNIFNLLGIVWSKKPKLLGIGFVLSCSVLTLTCDVQDKNIKY